MKTILLGAISLIMLIGISQEHEIKTVTASYNGFEDGIYYFSNKDEEYTFEEISAEAQKIFDLKGDKYIGEKFKVSYKEKELIDDFEETYSIWVITKLVLIE